MTDWEKAKARLGEFLRVRGGTIPAQAEADIRSALEEVEDARSYAAEIAQGVSHYPHEEAEPCVRCRAERAEAEVGALQQLAEIRLQESMRQEMAKEQAEAEVERLRGLIDGLLFEGGLQVHSVGCPHRLMRTRVSRGTEGPCRGCAAEAALRGER